jgi:cytochrome c oxidase cbb3-type subunit III
MNDQNDPLLLDHEADGIRELDNNLPRWWVWLFYLTIIFSVFYMGYYHVFARGELRSQGQMVTEYMAEKAIGDALKGASMAKFEAAMNSLVASSDAKDLDNGRQTFMTLCAPCHRPDGGGLVGPNLCDDYWIHGSNFVDSVRTIWNGVPEKGMITWKTTLNPQQIHNVASFLYTLRGTKPPNPKPPENLAPAKTGPSEYE